MAMRISATSRLAALLALVELALGGLCAFDAFETWAATFACNIDAAPVLLRKAVFDASKRARSADRLGTVALALSRTTREACGS